MKITLDLPSVLTGGAVALVLGLVAGFTPQVTQVPGATNVAPRQITGQFSPHPSDFVWLEARDTSNGFDSPTLTVPAGKVLVLTGFSSERGEPVRFFIDGVQRTFSLLRGYNQQGYTRTSSYTFPTGIPLSEGQTVYVRGANGSGAGYTWIHGYWADA